jgi:hypothetical protein
MGKQYRNRETPSYVTEAVQWFPGVQHPNVSRTFADSYDFEPNAAHLAPTVITAGDWITDSPDGESFLYHDQDFRNAYEPVDDVADWNPPLSGQNATMPPMIGKTIKLEELAADRLVSTLEQIGVKFPSHSWDAFEQYAAAEIVQEREHCANIAEQLGSKEIAKAIRFGGSK